MRDTPSKHPPVAEQDYRKLASVISWVTAAIAVIVVIAPPVSYFLLAYQSQTKESSLEAKVQSAFIIQVIIGSPETWQQEVGELLQTQLTYGSEDSYNEVRYIKTVEGELIAQTSDSLPKIAVTGITSLTDDYGKVVAELGVVHPINSMIKTTGWIFLVSAVFALVIFTTLRMLPLRALKLALTTLHKEQQTLKDSEERLRIVVDKSIDGIIIMNADYLIESFNPAAEQIFGYSQEDISKVHFNTLISPDTIPGNDEIIGDDTQRNISIDSIEAAAKRKDGSKFSAEFTLNEAHHKGETKYICSLRDITDRKAANDKLNYMANYDSLTGLPNRSLLRDRLSHAIHQADRNDSMLAVIFLDLDRFKNINDSLGHDVGDLLLQHVASLLQTALRKTDTVSRMEHELAEHDDNQDSTVARLGGDEFVLVLEGLTSAKGAGKVAQKILQSCAENPFIAGDNKIHISTSIGISLYPTDSTDLDGLIKHADTAMYRSKEMGRNMFNYYTNTLNTEANKRLSLEADLRHAIDNDEFELYYQPKVIASSQHVFGVEALIRWDRPGVGLVSPLEFIPVLEETGLILQVGQWVIETACKQCKAWLESDLGAIKVAVNLSARQFHQQDLECIISNAVSKSGISAEMLELEITETMLMEDGDNSVETLNRLKKMGLSISIDDFGTGYSSLSYLKRFPIDTLKIDQSFIRDISTDPNDAAITTAIIALAHNLKLNVIAEGVETQDGLTFLRDNGCDQIQGYLFSKPLPADDFYQWLKQHRKQLPSLSTITEMRTK